MRVTYVLVVLVAVVAVASTGFAVEQSTGQRVQPVPFEDTMTLGLPGVDVREAQASGYSVPKAEVFYSQFQYVVGYYGVESAAGQLVAPGTERQFGRPASVLVTDYADADPTLTPAGYVQLNETLGQGWVAADRASFVVDSRARTPSGPTVLPFSDPDTAQSFADRYGGRVLDWQGLLDRAGGTEQDPAAIRRRLVANRTAWADAQVASTAALRERPVSVVVGRDAPTLRAAVDRAPPNTTVELPAGRYRGNLTIDKPLTLRGVGNRSRIQGPGTGTVLRVRSPRVAVTDVHIGGVGPNGSSPVGNLSSDDWDARVRVAYGTGDAAIRFDNATGSLVGHVTIDTPATGVLAHHSRGLVVANATVRGSAHWLDGFMGVLPMYEPVVVQDSTFHGGRDAVYTHRARGVVVRRNDMRHMRYGVHEMYTSGALVRGNTMRDVEAGVIVMTRPRSNVIAGNDVRDSRLGVSLSGTASFVANNTVANDAIGVAVGGTRSTVSGNLLVGNGIGIRADTLMPSNLVYGNDVVGNDQPVDAGAGPVRIWTRDRGNYWGPLPGRDRDGDGTLDTPYHPTGAVDGALLSGPGAVTLRQSPAVTMLSQVRDAVPGLREGGVVDTAPLVHPVHPTRLDRLEEANP
ncbi:MAG: NosD domain-containing protein [Haloarculaceae archaeon]